KIEHLPEVPTTHRTGNFSVRQNLFGKIRKNVVYIYVSETILQRIWVGNGFLHPRARKKSVLRPNPL
ncbi:MAG: hypothetical protein AAF639_33020, partial [Chloroflexota bacterium]